MALVFGVIFERQLIFCHTQSSLGLQQESLHFYVFPIATRNDLLKQQIFQLHFLLL